MGRPNRDFTTDNRFHVINRGVDRQDLFSIEDDWLLFEGLIGRVCDDYSFRLNAYALMSNHFHFLVDLSECDDRSGVSSAIGVLQSTYASYFNDRTGRRGPLFDPRFLSFGVDGDTRTHRVVRYIHRNPIDICGPRALGNYRWSSLPVALGRRQSPQWLDCSLFAPLDSDAHLADLARCTTSDLLPLDDLSPQRYTTFDELHRAVIDLPAEVADRRERRALVCLLALDLRICDVMLVAEQLHCLPGTVRNIAAHARAQRRSDVTFDRLIDRVVSELALRRC